MIQYHFCCWAYNFICFKINVSFIQIWTLEILCLKYLKMSCISTGEIENMHTSPVCKSSKCAFFMNRSINSDVGKFKIANGNLDFLLLQQYNNNNYLNKKKFYFTQLHCSLCLCVILFPLSISFDLFIYFLQFCPL